MTRLALTLGVALVALTAPAAQADLIHQYRLDGSYADDLGGPSLVPNGGFLGPTRYTFDANQGLSLSNALTNGGVYSIELVFEFDALTGYRKILDFMNLTSDDGLYTLNPSLTFYRSGNIGATGTDVTPNTDARIVLTRDAAGLVTGYVDGVQQFSFADTIGAGAATFTGPGNIMWFFRDDPVVPGETATGSVDLIRVYDTPLTAAQVAALVDPVSGTVPEPATLAVFAGLAGIGGLVARRRKPVWTA